MNIAANTSLSLAAAAAGLILPPMFIAEYGSDVNGMVGSIRQFMAYLGLVEAGIGAASMAALYAPLTAVDFSRVSSIVSATRLFYRRSGYFLMALVGMLAVIYPILVAGEVNRTLAVVMVVIIGSGAVGEFFLIGKYRVLLAADQRDYAVSITQTIATVISTVVAVLMISRGADVVVVQMASTLIAISRYFFLRRLVKNYYPAVDFRARPDYSSISARWSAFAHQIASVVIFSSPILLLTIFAGLRDVSVFMVYSMVFTAVGAVIGVVSTGLHAGFGQMLAGGERKALASVYTNFEYVFYALTMWTFTVTSILIMPFMNLYTRGFTDTNYVRPDVAALFVVIGIANNVRIPSNVLVTSAGHFRQTQSRAFLEAAINLGLSLALVPRFGIVGVLLGSVGSYAYRTVDFLFYVAHNLLYRSVWISIVGVARNITLGAIAAVPVVLWVDVEAQGFGDWLMYAFGVGGWVLVIIVVGNLLIDPKMFREALTRIRTAAGFAP